MTSCELNLSEDNIENVVANDKSKTKKRSTEAVSPSAAKDAQYLEIIKLFLHLHPEVARQTEKTTRTPLHRAAEKGIPSLLQALLQANAEVDATASYWWRDGYTALHVAASRGHYDCCRILVEHKADVNKQTVN